MLTLELDILLSKREIRLGAFTLPIILPVYLDASEMAPPASSVAATHAASDICASLSLVGAAVRARHHPRSSNRTRCRPCFKIHPADVPLGEA